MNRSKITLFRANREQSSSGRLSTAWWCVRETRVSVEGKGSAMLTIAGGGERRRWRHYEELGLAAGEVNSGDGASPKTVGWQWRCSGAAAAAAATALW